MFIVIQRVCHSALYCPSDDRDNSNYCGVKGSRTTFYTRSTYSVLARFIFKAFDLFYKDSPYDELASPGQIPSTSDQHERYEGSEMASARKA
jgi:hypothetical protein